MISLRHPFCVVQHLVDNRIFSFLVVTMVAVVILIVTVFESIEDVRRMCEFIQMESCYFVTYGISHAKSVNATRKTELQEVVDFSRK